MSKASVPPVRERRETSDGASGSIDPAMLELLVCPQTRGPLQYDADADELVSRAARLAYPVRDGIPILLVSEARPLTD